MAQTIPTTVSDFQSSLAKQALATDVTIELTFITDIDGNNLTPGLYSFTLDGDIEEYKEYVIGNLSGTVLSNVMSINAQGIASSGLSKYHRRGALVSMTDWVALGKVVNALRGLEKLDASSPLEYDDNLISPTPNQIPNIQFVLDVVNGGPVSFTQQVLTAQVAGENLTANDHVYFKDDDQRWWKVKADDTNTFSLKNRGIVLTTQTVGGTISVAINGIVDGFISLTPGDIYYASNIAGEIATTPGDDIVLVGTALSATQLIFNPYLETVNFNSIVPAGTIVSFGAAIAPNGWLLADGSAVSRTTYANLFEAIGDDYGGGDGTTTFNLPDLRGRFPVGMGIMEVSMTFVSRSSNIITVTGVVNLPDNEIQTGQAILYRTDGAPITGLTDNTTYYLIRQSNNSFSLATSRANAIAGTVISLSSDGSGTQTFTLTGFDRSVGMHGGETYHSLTITEMPSHTHTGNNSNENNVQGGSNSKAISGNSGATGGSGQHNNMPPYLTVAYIIKY